MKVNVSNFAKVTESLAQASFRSRSQAHAVIHVEEGALGEAFEAGSSRGRARRPLRGDPASPSEGLPAPLLSRAGDRADRRPQLAGPQREGEALSPRHQPVQD